MQQVSQIDRIAILLQFGASTALVLLFGLALRRVTARAWLTSWSRAWSALWVAILAVTLRFDVLLPLSSWRVTQQLGAMPAHLLDLLYMGGKLAYFALLFDGAWTLSRGAPLPALVRRGAMVMLLAATVLLVVGAPNIDALVVRQSLLAVPALAGAAVLMGLRPRRRGDYGTLLLGAVFTVLTLLWCGYYYGIASGGAFLRTTGSGALLGQLLSNNSVVDTLMQLLLGYAMVIVLSEDVGAALDQNRRAQLDALATSETRLTRIIEAALDAIVTLDSDFRIIQANAAAGTVLGVAPSRLIGESFTRFLPPSLAATWRTEWALDGEALPSSSRHQFRGRRGTSEEFPADISLAPIGPDRAGGYVLVLRDESESERTAAERERMRQRLAQSQRLETVGQLVSGVAHELNNPLAAILAFTEELKHGPMGRTEEDALTTIEQQALRCRTIVRDLLRVARKREVRLRAIAPRQLLMRVMRGFEPAASAARLSLRLDVPATLPDVIGDETALEQILANLITNALQVSPPGGHVITEAMVADSERLVVTVEDEGDGIPPDVQARLFEPFFTTKPVGEGTGLGLAVSRGLVEQLGGTIALENRPAPNRGVRAVITLPLAKGEQLRAEPTALPVAQGLGRRALVIDDEAPVRAAVRRFLERTGWRVDEAPDGRSALERLTAVDGGEAYAAIICDLRMPNLSGIELHDLLAATRPDLLRRTIIITGDVASPNVADFLARIWAPVLEKPFDLALLGAALDRVAPTDAPNSQRISTP